MDQIVADVGRIINFGYDNGGMKGHISILSLQKIVTILFWAIIFLVFFTSLGIKVWSLGHGYSSFDDDEIFSALFIRNSWSDIFRLNAYDSGNPPLYFLILKGWSGIFGQNEIGIRSFSLLTDSLIFWLIFWLCKKTLKFNRFQLVTISVLYAFSGVMFYYSLYGRAYDLLVFVCLLTLFFWVENRKKIVNWGFVVSGLFGLYLHYSAIFFLVFLAIGTVLSGLIAGDWRKEAKRVLMNNTLLLVGYLPWITMFIKDQTNVNDASRKYIFWQLVPGSEFLKLKINEWLTIFSSNLVKVNMFWSGVVMIMLGLWCWWYMWKNIRVIRRRGMIVILMTVWVYLIGLFGFGLNKLLITERYSLFVFPLVWICLVDMLLKNLDLVRMLVVLVLLGFWILNQRNFYIPFNDHDGRRIAESVREGKVLLENCFYKNNFEFYYKGDDKVFCGLPLTDVKLTSGEKLYILENKWSTAGDSSWTSVDVDNWIKEDKFINLKKTEFGNGYTVFLVQGS